VSAKARLDVNVALNRPAYSVSTYTEILDTFSANFGNDGNADTHFYNNWCTATLLETNPWWAVDLGVVLYVYGVKFVNRGDCCGQFNLHRNCGRHEQ